MMTTKIITHSETTRTQCYWEWNFRKYYKHILVSLDMSQQKKKKDWIWTLINIQSFIVL